MSKKKRILVCFGTRAEAVKLCPLCKKLADVAELETIILYSGQHREMGDSVLEYFGVSADIRLDIMRDGQTPEYVVETLRGIMPSILERLMPDVVLVQGDTATALGCALSAKEMSIPVAHIEAGLRSGNDASPYPEEIYRKKISAISKWHFAPSESAKANLLCEGIDEGDIFVTGNTVIDALLYATEHRESVDPAVSNIDYTKPTVLLTSHRRENLGQGMSEIFSAVKELVGAFDTLRVIYPMHKSEQIRGIFRQAQIDCDRLTVTEPLDYVSFVYAMSKCRFVISDSGGVQEEAAYLGIPCIIARDTTERGEAVLEGAALLCGASHKAIYQSAARLLADECFYNSLRGKRYKFGDGRASDRIIKILSKIV